MSVRSNESVFTRAKASPQARSPMLMILHKAEASLSIREAWTRKLLAFGDEMWDCEDKTLVRTTASHRPFGGR